VPYPLELSQWIVDVSSPLGVLSGSQARRLALYSYAVMMTQSGGMSHGSFFVSRLLNQRENTARQRLREFTYEAVDKRGAKRWEVVGRQGFVPLLRGGQRLWCRDDENLVLALDATTLREVFTVLRVSVPLTVSEVRRLWYRLVWQVTHSVEQILAWSFGRRRHQARAKAAHYRRRLARSPA
jgi:hypothetical protein